MLDDAVDMALRDQGDAGIDIVSDGEMRRAGFFTAAFYSFLTGLRALPPDRKLGPAGHDQQHRFAVEAPIAAPNGLGTVAELEYVRTRTAKPVKMTIPGPFTLAGRLQTGTVYPTRVDAAWACVPIINAELKALVAAGADFIQVDEPSPAIRPEERSDFAELFNAAVEGIDVRLATHLCFGNYAGKPLGRRMYGPLLDQMMRFRVDQFVLEYANREMAELELLSELAAERELAIGVVDVKNSYVESAQDVADRLRAVLRHVPAEKLSAVPDCGFSQTPRGISRKKLHALVEGTKIVRAELSGS
jgi:5-methyltetrahydropteroyltriglutamate--homocysteine methyltransferase